MKKLILIFMLLSTLIFAELIKAKVTYVTDGDTFHILLKNKKEKVRLFGVDAPETKQEWGLESKEALNKMISGKEVLLDVKEKDKYGRIVAIVFVGKNNINLKMIETGNAWWYEFFDKKNTESEKAMLTAKVKKIGLWSKKNPIEPYEFRKDN